MPERLRISLKPNKAMMATRIALSAERLVYVICADRKLKYPKGKSPVAYIGTTRKGAQRIAQSVAARAEHVLNMHGIKSFDVRVITTSPRQGVKTWHVLERALLLEFKKKYGRVPECNVVGKNIEERSEFDIFARKRVRDIIETLENHGRAPDREVIDLDDMSGNIS